MGYACAGQGGYSDIGPGTTVTVTDDSGKLVAKGAIDSSYSASGACMLTFKVFDVPGGAKFYKVQVSHPRRDELHRVGGQSRNHGLLGRFGVHHDSPAPLGHSRATGPRTGTTSETHSRRPTTQRRARVLHPVSFTLLQQRISHLSRRKLRHLLRICRTGSPPVPNSAAPQWARHRLRIQPRDAAGLLDVLQRQWRRDMHRRRQRDDLPLLAGGVRPCRWPAARSSRATPLCGHRQVV
jgi:hypothetical protein